jgi:PilZ domain
MDRRDHHRVQLRLPARLRWTTPFGQKTEVCTAVDVSRGGMLVPCREPHAEGMSLWVTFPFNASLIVGQPEVLARVVRAMVVVRDDVATVGAKKKNGNGNGHGNGHGKNGNGANGHGTNGHGGNGNGHKVGNGNGHHHGDGANVFRSPSATEAAAVEAGREFSDFRGESESKVAIVRDADVAIATDFLTLLALRFEIAPTRQWASAHAIVPLRDVERRAVPRRPFVVPVRVRTEHMPWFEETMTVDCSGDGLRFRSSREYRRGEFLFVSFESAATSPWLGVTESLLRVVRVESEPDVAELHVAVSRTQQFAFRF